MSVHGFYTYPKVVIFFVYVITMETFLIAIIALYIPKDGNISCICNNYGNIFNCINNIIHTQGFGLWGLNATFNNISVTCGGKFYWWRKPEYPEKTSDLPQIIDNFIT